MNKFLKIVIRRSGCLLRLVDYLSTQIFYCCITNYHKFRSPKQYKFIISQSFSEGQRSKHAMTGFSAYGSHLAEISVGKAAVVPRVCGSPPGTLVADRIPFLVIGGLKSPFTHRLFAT